MDVTTIIGGVEVGTRHNVTAAEYVRIVQALIRAGFRATESNYFRPYRFVSFTSASYSSADLMVRDPR